MKIHYCKHCRKQIVDRSDMRSDYGFKYCLRCFIAVYGWNGD